MATHKANINFYLYTAFDSTALDGFQAKQDLDASGIQYTLMHYYDADQVLILKNWVKTTFAETEYAVESPQFPFVVYEKAFDIKDTPPRIQVLVHGLEDILATPWAELEQFEG
jgi:hypothetical protein